MAHPHGRSDAATDTVRELIDEKSVEEFNYESKKKIADHDRLMMAVIGKFEKQGKGRSGIAVRSDGPFPFFSIDGYCGRVPLLMEDRKSISIADLYPQLSQEHREQAEVNIRRYLAALLRMEEDLHNRSEPIRDSAVDCRFDSDDEQRYHPDAKGRATNTSSSNS